MSSVRALEETKIYRVDYAMSGSARNKSLMRGSKLPRGKKTDRREKILSGDRKKNLKRQKESCQGGNFG